MRLNGGRVAIGYYTGTRTVTRRGGDAHAAHNKNQITRNARRRRRHSSVHWLNERPLTRQLHSRQPGRAGPGRAVVV